MNDQTTFVEFGRAAYMTGLPHRVRPPARPGPHPTVVLVHGRHGNENVTWVFAKSFAPDWLAVAPRAIEFEPETPDSEDGWSWLPGSIPLWPNLDDFDEAVTALKDFIEALPDAYDADPNNIFVLGFSQGAAAALALAIRHPGLIRGIAALVGFAPEPPPEVTEQRPLDGLPVFMAAGVRDERIPLTVAQRGRDIVAKAGGIVTYGEYQTGHKLNSHGLRDLAAWWQARAAEIKQ